MIRGFIGVSITVIIFLIFYKKIDKNRKIMIMTILLLCWFPYLFDYFFMGNIKTKMNMSEWSSFLGGYIGAVITLIGVSWQIKNDNESKKEDILLKQNNKKESVKNYFKYILETNKEIIIELKRSNLYYNYIPKIKMYPKLECVSGQFVENNYNNFFLENDYFLFIKYFREINTVSELINYLIENIKKKEELIIKLPEGGIKSDLILLSGIFNTIVAPLDLLIYKNLPLDTKSQLKDILNEETLYLIEESIKFLKNETQLKEKIKINKNIIDVEYINTIKSDIRKLSNDFIEAILCGKIEDNQNIINEYIEVFNKETELYQRLIDLETVYEDIMKKIYKKAD